MECASEIERSERRADIVNHRREGFVYGLGTDLDVPQMMEAKPVDGAVMTHHGVFIFHVHSAGKMFTAL